MRCKQGLLVLGLMCFIARDCECLDFNRIQNRLENLRLPGNVNLSTEGLINQLGPLVNNSLGKRGPFVNEVVNNGLNKLRPLLSKILNFSRIAPDLDIVLGNTKLNRHSFTLAKDELKVLERLLHGLSFNDAMKIWGLTAKFLQRFQTNLKRFDVKDLHLFENDIALTESQIRARIKEADEYLRTKEPTPQKRSVDGRLEKQLSRPRRKITVVQGERWDKVIHWHMEKKLFAPNEEAMIRRGLDQWEQETCLSFIHQKTKPSGDYINFSKHQGCSSYVGRVGKGQDISLNGKICFHLGVVMHEIGHALGMWHEQSRPDRKRYVTLDETNMEQGMLGQFQMRDWLTTESAGIPYDYGSVMHYGRRDFSWNSRDTLKPKWFGYEQTIGQVRTASFHDVKIINYRYCEDQCSPNTLEWYMCENDGYRNPRNCNQCKCPEGFKPPYCKQVQDQTIAKCGTNERRALARWSTLTSPDYPNSLVGPGTCFWRITTPAGTRVELEFVDDFLLPDPPSDACTDYIEVRYKDLALTGPRFCGFNKPYKPFISEEQSVLLLMRTTSSRPRAKGFKLRFRAAGCGGCNPRAPDSQPTCAETYRYTCRGLFKCNWLGRKFCRRSNTCLRTTETCCSGYRKAGHMCTKIK